MDQWQEKKVHGIMVCIMGNWLESSINGLFHLSSTPVRAVVSPCPQAKHTHKRLELSEEVWVGGSISLLPDARRCDSTLKGVQVALKAAWPP